MKSSDVQPQSPVRKRRFHYAWVVAITGGFAILVGVEPLSLFGVFLGPIVDDLGASRAAVSAAYWIAFASMGVASPFAGWAVDHIGIRKVLLMATIGTVLPLVMLSQVRSIAGVYLWYGVVYGIARAGYNAPVLMTVTLWFKKKQGLAVGIVSSGLAVGPTVFAPLFRYLISLYGWGYTFFILGIISGIVLLPCCWLMRNRPSDMGLRRYGEDDEAAEITKVTGKKPAPSYQPLFYRTNVANFTRYAMTTQPFYILPLIHFIGCVSHAIPLAHVVIMATDRGIDPIAASSVLGVATGLSAAARFFAPIMADRIGGRKVLVWFILAQGLSILTLLQANDLWTFYFFSLAFGLCYGGEMAPFPVINRQYYGTAPIGLIFGFQATLASLGMGLGGFLGGFLYDLMGDYTVAIWVASLAGVCGAALSYMLVDPFKPGKRFLKKAGLISSLPESGKVA